MNVPQLRFKEFSGEWEEKKLYEISDIKTGPFGSTLHEADYVLSGTPIITVEHLGEQGVVHQNLPLVSDDDKARLKSYHLKEGDVVFSRVGSVDRSCLISPEENGWLFSGRLLRVRLTSDNACPKFLNQNFKNDLVKYRVRSVAVGQTMASLNTEILKNFHLIFPPSKPEQIKIANFLTAVDEKIAQLTQKIDLLARYKKGVMQQIFSQQLRFKDEDGQEFPEWEIKKIGCIFEERSERGFSDMELLSVTINDGLKKRTDIEGKDNSSQDKGNYKRVLKNDIAYNSMRMWQGANGVSKFDGIVSPAYTVLKSNPAHNSLFFGYLFKTKKMIQIFERNSQGLTSDTWNLKYTQLSMIKVTIPCYQEQTKIANFLAALDDKINHNQTQLNALKQYKQGLLQQLFV